MSPRRTRLPWPGRRSRARGHVPGPSRLSPPMRRTRPSARVTARAPVRAVREVTRPRPGAGLRVEDLGAGKDAGTGRVDVGAPRDEHRPVREQRSRRLGARDTEEPGRRPPAGRGVVQLRARVGAEDSLGGFRRRQAACHEDAPVGQGDREEVGARGVEAARRHPEARRGIEELGFDALVPRSAGSADVVGADNQHTAIGQDHSVGARAGEGERAGRDPACRGGSRPTGPRTGTGSTGRWTPTAKA